MQPRNARLAQHIKEDVIWPNQDICFWKTENGRLDIGSRTKQANDGGHPFHVPGTKRDFPKRSDAKVAKDEFMANQNKISFRPATGCTIDEFVEVYFRDIAEGGMYCITRLPLKAIEGTGESISNLCYEGR